MILLSFIFLIIGIISKLYSPFFLLLSLLPIAYMCFYKKYKKKYYLTLIFLIVGYLLVLLKQLDCKEVVEQIGVVIKSKENYILLLTVNGKFYIPIKDNQISVFSLLKVSGFTSDLSFSHYESSFDFKEYLNGQGVFYQLNIKNKEILLNNIINFDVLKKYMFYYLDENAKIIVSSLLFSTSIYDLKISSDLSSLNVLNYLSLSGLHISFLLKIIDVFLSKKSEKASNIIQIIISALFLVFSDFSYSMKRVFILAILKVIKYKNNKINFLNRISLTGIILLIFEPASIMSQSFYRSFPFLFFIAIFMNNQKKKKLSFFMDIQLFNLPLNLNNNSGFSLLFIFTSLMALFISQFLFILSVLLLILPPIGYLINVIVKITLTVFNYISIHDIFLISGEILPIFIVLYYFLLIIIKTLKNYNFKKESKIVQISLLSALTLTLIPDFTSHYEITFIDVDQGDSTLIRYKDKNILIDTGGKVNTDMAKQCLIPYFQKRKIRKIDALLITHGDFDHDGAKDSLCKNFNVNKVYYASDFLLNENYTLNICGLEIKNYNHYYKASDEENTTSAVYGFTIKNTKILITGDAPKEIEKQIIQNDDVSADILRIAHHGSNTSSSYTFLKKINPKVCIISVGVNNKYHHPSKETLTTLNYLQLKVRRTDLEGTISYKL